MILMNYGEENRIYKETHIHEHSSRSHTIFRVFIQKTVLNENQPDPDDFETNKNMYYSVLNLVDLAGSERLCDMDMKQEI
jgi:centromeric protein E